MHIVSLHYNIIIPKYIIDQLPFKVTYVIISDFQEPVPTASGNYIPDWGVRLVVLALVAIVIGDC